MKKLLGIVVLGLLFGGSAYAKTFTFSKCANQMSNFIFQPTKFEKFERVIDTKAQTVTVTTIFTDEHYQELLNKKNIAPGQPKYYFQKDKIDFFNEQIVKTTRVENYSKSQVVREAIYDLETKIIQITSKNSNPDIDDDVVFIQCQ